ncbi:uncharacterized protein METZ01_LOCUS191469, partial [marine metagenome]
DSMTYLPKIITHPVKQFSEQRMFISGDSRG